MLTDPTRLTDMSVVVTIPHKAPQQLAWWRQLAADTLRDVVTQADRKPHGRVRTTVAHGLPATVTASVPTRPAR